MAVKEFIWKSSISSYQHKVRLHKGSRSSLKWVKAFLRFTFIRDLVLYEKKNNKSPTFFKVVVGSVITLYSLIQLLLALRLICLGPVKLVPLWEHEALQVPVLSPLLQPLFLQYRNQHVSFLYRPHDLRQDLLLLLQLRRALLCVWSKTEEKNETPVRNLKIKLWKSRGYFLRNIAEKQTKSDADMQEKRPLQLSDMV